MQRSDEGTIQVFILLIEFVYIVLGWLLLNWKENVLLISIF